MTAPFGSWKSPITSDLIAARSIGLSEIRLDGDEIYWLELRPHEAGRTAVVNHGSGQDLLPAPISVRTRVHEYGGGAWNVVNGSLYYSNFQDQRLYCLDRGAAEPRALTPEGPFRYGDGLIDPIRREWLGVREDHSAPGHESSNTIVRIGAGETRVLLSGHDFYSSPRLSPDGRSLAWLQWDHPRMPWVGTTLSVVRLDHEGMPEGSPVAIAGGERESVFQPEWSPDGSELFFISDRTGWWNLYRYSFNTQQGHAILPMEAEFGQPQWVFGLATYAFAGRDRLVCSYTAKGLGRLGVIDLTSGRLHDLDLPYTDVSSVRAHGDRVVFRGGSATLPASYVVLNLKTGRTETLKQSTAVADDPSLARYFTRVEAIEFPTVGERTAFALYYPPFNPDYQAPADEKPPLLVKCHGGPTAAASSTLDLRTQYWTSRGVAVLDVNYGGSTGFGREYRERLDGTWGIVDVDDCVNGARHLAEQGLVDGRRSVITGGSAGGFTVLAALAFRDHFAGGASHYGVSDLTVLARDTHKFESRYLDSLVGPYPEREDLYRQRSPIHGATQLRAPVIFFQGDEDMVVPPNQTEMMVEALRRNGVPVGYFLFGGEQHGFRKAENIKRSLDAELYFYAVNVFHCALTFA
ncbi:MAG TPA: S9 family peptidase [Bryobacteraceae bacterium]|jgi:dipeptidyl aminopeptidase/acylaminoacyl peptidase